MCIALNFAVCKRDELLKIFGLGIRFWCCNSVYQGICSVLLEQFINNSLMQCGRYASVIAFNKRLTASAMSNMWVRETYFRFKFSHSVNMYQSHGELTASWASTAKHDFIIQAFLCESKMSPNNLLVIRAFFFCSRVVRINALSRWGKIKSIRKSHGSRHISMCMKMPRHTGHWHNYSQRHRQKIHINWYEICARTPFIWAFT